jgi:hypothetical protein
MPRDGFSRKYGKAELASSDASGLGGVASHHARDKVFCGDTILSMNAFWNFLQTCSV